MKAVEGTFNQEKALVGDFSVIVQLHRLIVYSTRCDEMCYSQRADPLPHTLRAELRQEVLLRGVHLALPALPPLHPPPGAHGTHRMRENIYWVRRKYLVKTKILSTIDDDSFRVFKTEKRLEQFYSLLIKESLDREDVNSLEKENVR